MTIAKQFFTTLINTVRHTDDAKALRAHMNAVNARHYGNALKPAKQFAYFADMMGTANANKFTAQLDDQLSHGKYTPTEKIDAALTPMMSTVAEVGQVGRVVSHGESVPHWLMSLPLLTLTTTGSDEDPNRNTFYLGVDLTVEYTRAHERVIVDATLRLYDTDMTDYDISYAMDVLTPDDLVRYFSDDMEMGFGEITNIALHEGALRFSPLAVTPTLEDESPVISFLVYGVCQHLISELAGTCTLAVQNANSATHQLFYASGDAHGNEPIWL